MCKKYTNIFSFYLTTKKKEKRKKKKKEKPTMNTVSKAEAWEPNVPLCVPGLKTQTPRLGPIIITTLSRAEPEPNRTG